MLPSSLFLCDCWCVCEWNDFPACSFPVWILLIWEISWRFILLNKLPWGGQPYRYPHPATHTPAVPTRSPQHFSQSCILTILTEAVYDDGVLCTLWFIKSFYLVDSCKSVSNWFVHYPVQSTPHFIWVSLSSFLSFLSRSIFVLSLHPKKMNFKRMPVGWLLYVPATCKCISGTDLLRRVYILPHWDRSCILNFLSYPVTVYWHLADQSPHWPYNARRMAG